MYVHTYNTYNFIVSFFSMSSVQLHNNYAIAYVRITRLVARFTKSLSKVHMYIYTSRAGDEWTGTGFESYAMINEWPHGTSASPAHLEDVKDSGLWWVHVVANLNASLNESCHNVQRWTQSASLAASINAIIINPIINNRHAALNGPVHAHGDVTSLIYNVS